MEKADSDWIRTYQPRRPGATDLICLPHAGGSASYFRPLAEALSPWRHVMAAQYPGRQDRLREPLISDLGRLADEIYTAVVDELRGSVLIFGHSMGALIGFELALRLERDSDIKVLQLFVSGRPAPSVVRSEGVELTDAGLIAEARRLQGTEVAFLEDPELARMILPAMREDYAAVINYTRDETAKVDCPITAMLGDSDPKVTTDEARRWARHTRGEFDLVVFRGGHFYLAENTDDVMRILRRSSGAN